MTPRQRILAILNRKSVDRLPRDFWHDHIESVTHQSVGHWLRTWQTFLLGFVVLALNSLPGATVVPAANPVGYADGRPSAKYRLEAQDAGVVLQHGDGPDRCDYLGARDVWVWKSGGTYFMHYDGAGTNGWLACLATSRDLTNWTKFGPVLALGQTNEDDSASASYGTTYFDGKKWHMFYLGTRHATPAPDRIPTVPYLTMKASSASPWGPWVKEPAVLPFRPGDIPAANYGTAWGVVASPGMIVKSGDEYLMFVSGGGYSAKNNRGPFGNITLARTKDIEGQWSFDPQPMLPWDETCENSSLYFEPTNQTWFLFCNHIHHCTDAVWVYWTKDLNHWHSDDKAVVLDGTNCRWSHECIGLPSVVQVGHRLAIFYDAPGGDSTSHIKRDVGLAWLDLPLNPPIALSDRQPVQTIHPDGLRAAGAAQAGLVPRGLRCEYLDHPLGLGVAQPHFSWQLPGATARETAYRVLVTSDDQAAVVWDSGKVESAAQNGIVYDGKSLTGKTAYSWRVSTWDQSGHESPWSNPATFETGILDLEKDWAGVWVGGPPADATNQFNLIRRRFDLPAGKRIVKARAYVAAQHFPLSFFVFRVNGRMPEEVFPLRSSTFFGVGIYTLDVTKLLHPGENVFGAMFGDIGNPRNNDKSRDQNSLLCDLTVWFADGSRTNLGTTAQCLGYQGGPVISADMYDGEVYDARRNLAWDQPGFDDRDWQPCAVLTKVAKPKQAVLNRVCVFDTLAPVKVTQPKPGVFIADVGTQISGWAQLRVSGPAGTRVTLRYAERLYPDGTLDMSTITNAIPAKQTDSYTLSGQGTETWEPQLTYHGFRYVELTGFPGVIKSKNLRFRRAAADVQRETAQFECSNPSLNRIYQAFYNTELDNLMFDHSGCNQRAERAPWTADVMCVSEASMAYFDVAHFFQEMWIDLSNARSGPHGESSAVLYDAGGFALLWQSHCVRVPWDYWQAYGDKMYLAPGFERAQKFCDCLVNWFDKLDEVVYDAKTRAVVTHTDRGDWLIDAETPWHDPDGKPRDNFLKYWGDWQHPALAPGPAHAHPWTLNASFLTSAYYFHDLDLTARMAAALGKADDAAHYHELAGKVRDAINARWLKEKRFYCDNDQTPNAVALDFGIVPAAARTAVLASLLADIQARTNHLNTGVLGTLSLVPALADNGRNDVVFALATQHSYPSWLYMMDRGPGTFWEDWNDAPLSKCHMYLGGSIAAWLLQHVAGIKPLQPGYEQIEFRPALVGDLTFARATVPTVRGPVTSEWSRHGHTFHWKISVPPNSSATVYVPGQTPVVVSAGIHKFTSVIQLKTPDSK